MKWIETLLELLFPSKCPFCQHILFPNPGPVCPECQNKLPWRTGRYDQHKPEFIELCVSPLAYQEPVIASVHRYKFSGHRSYARSYGILIAQCVRDQIDTPIHQVSWVPLSRARLRKRGFDQAEKLARVVGKELGLPVVPTLEKIRSNQQQSLLTDPAARRANVLGAYQIRPDADVVGRRVLLIDDVVTSGATLSECARILQMAGSEQIFAATLVQAGSSKENQAENPKT